MDGRIIDMAGHLHDIDIIDPSWCPTHCPERGGAIALSAELMGGSASTYYGPIPPNNSPPADLTGATLCRSEGNHGTSFGAGERQQRASRHRQPLRDLQRHARRAARRRHIPPSGEYPSDGIPITAGQVIRLHSEYQNDSGSPKTDVMGIMQAWYVPSSPGYPRREGRDAHARVAGARLQPVHGAQPHARPVTGVPVVQPAGAHAPRS